MDNNNLLLAAILVPSIFIGSYFGITNMLNKNNCTELEKKLGIAISKAATTSDAEDNKEVDNLAKQLELCYANQVTN